MRVTRNGVKSYIFQASLYTKTIHITIGNISTWKLGEARQKARRLKLLTDQGADPSEIKQKQKIDQAEKEHRRVLDETTLGEAWKVYIEARKPYWSARYYQDNVSMMATGKELDSLANIRLIDITSSRLITWAKSESYRPARARLALRLLQAFLFWCMGNDDAYDLVK